MSLKHGLLGLLNYGATTGYDLDKEFKKSLNFFWQAQTSQIYRELNTMERQGWLISEVIQQSDKPNKKLYAMTPSGREELIRWLSENTIEEDLKVRDPFLVKLFFSGEMDAASNISTMKQFRQCCDFALKKIEEGTSHCKDQTDQNPNRIYWDATASFGHYYYAMCIQWADDTIGRLEAVK
jgi:DNA-binding PadR family transcriptional regulator